MVSALLMGAVKNVSEGSVTCVDENFTVTFLIDDGNFGLFLYIVRNFFLMSLEITMYRKALVL